MVSPPKETYPPSTPALLMVSPPKKRPPPSTPALLMVSPPKRDPPPSTPALLMVSPLKETPPFYPRSPYGKPPKKRPPPPSTPALLMVSPPKRDPPFYPRSSYGKIFAGFCQIFGLMSFKLLPKDENIIENTLKNNFQMIISEHNFQSNKWKFLLLLHTLDESKVLY